jgi:hypothetical protein
MRGSDGQKEVHHEPKTCPDAVRPARCMASSATKPDATRKRVRATVKSQMHRKRTGGIDKADIEPRLILIDRDERRTVVVQRILGQILALSGVASRGDDPSV